MNSNFPFLFIIIISLVFISCEDESGIEPLEKNITFEKEYNGGANIIQTRDCGYVIPSRKTNKFYIEKLDEFSARAQSWSTVEYLYYR